jgi:hypothetical protein
MVFRLRLGATALLLIAGPALALDPKQCLPLVEMNAALKAEGQRSLIISNREVIVDPTGNANDWIIKHFANIVSADTAGNLGYQIEGDLPRAQASTKMCVRARLTNVRLFDANKPGVPQAARLGGLFTSSAEELEGRGIRVMLVADTLHPQGANYRAGSPLVVFGSMQNRGGSMATMTAKGPVQIMIMSDTDYTPEALRRLGLSSAR